MSQFKTQRLANQYPLYSKIRRDPSSLGQRFFSAFAEYFDFAESELWRMKDEFFLLKWHLGKTSLWSIDLLEADYLPLTTLAGGGQKVTYPTTVNGDHSILGALTLVRDTSLEELLHREPTRLSLADTLAIQDITIWDSSAPGTFGVMAYPERLSINVESSTRYKRKTALNDRMFNDFYGIILKGKDINGLDIQESINVRDDGVYTTRNIWSKIEEAPDYDGFDGNITIGYKAADYPYVVDIYHVGVLIDVEGPLKLRTSVAAEESNITVLEYLTDRYKVGTAYRTGDVAIDNIEVIAPQILKDSDGGDIEAVDLTISYENTLLYVIDTNGFLHVYEHGLHAFDPPSEDIATEQIRIRIDPLQHYAQYNQTMSLWTHHAFPRDNINSVVIKRTSPSGTSLYLQSDLSWNVSPYTFLGNIDAKEAADSWQDIKFETTFDEYGQWDYYTTVRSGSDITVAHTAVMVDSLDALVSIDTEIANPNSIFFSQEGYVTITDGTNYYKFNEHRDSYFADPVNQQLIFREDYNDVEVTY